VLHRSRSANRHHIALWGECPAALSLAPHSPRCCRSSPLSLGRLARAQNLLRKFPPRSLNNLYKRALLRPEAPLVHGRLLIVSAGASQRSPPNAPCPGREGAQIRRSRAGFARCLTPSLTADAKCTIGAPKLRRNSRGPTGFAAGPARNAVLTMTVSYRPPPPVPPTRGYATSPPLPINGTLLTLSLHVPA